MARAGKRARTGSTSVTGVDTRAALHRIARPRLVGSEGADEVTAYVRDTLTRLGYDVRDHGFRFNAWPGRFGVSAAGAAHMLGSFIAAVFLYRGEPYGALAMLLLVVVSAGAIAAFARPLFELIPWGHIDGLNLLAFPAGRRPKYLVVAHRDSKSQPVPLSFRGPAIALALLAWIALFVLSLLSMAQPVARSLVLVIGILAFLAGVILFFCWVDNHSPGALDNASGVATLLGLAAQQRAAGDVAFLVTDAEELGLAGASAIAGRLPNVIGAINLDGIDDAGSFYFIERFGWPKKRGEAAHLAAALLTAADELGLEARRRDAPFGILLDHMPLVNAGVPALTVLHGGLASLRRVHRPGDDLDHLRGEGIDTAVRLVARALDILRAREPALR